MTAFVILSGFFPSWTFYENAPVVDDDQKLDGKTIVPGQSHAPLSSPRIVLFTPVCRHEPYLPDD